MTWDPDGIVVGEAFADYVEDLRASWDEPTENHGYPAGNGGSDTCNMTDDSDTESSIDTNITRRRAMQLAGATTAAAVAGTAPAAAADDFNVDSEYAPDYALEAQIEIGEKTLGDNTLAYVADDGSDATLADAGGMVQPKPESDDGSPVAHNPIELRADAIVADEYRDFPRGETYDADGDGSADTDVTALDATHWTKDMSGSAGTATIADTESYGGGNALQISTSSQTSGDVAVATFTPEDIIDNAGRKELQAVIDVASTGGTVSLIASDGSTDASMTIASSTGVAVHQSQISDLNSNLSQISEIRVEVADGNADVTFAALNAESESPWDLGVEEYVFTNNDGEEELGTRVKREPTGWYTIRGFDAADFSTAFESSTFTEIRVDTKFNVGDLPDDHVDVEFSDADRHSYPYHFEGVVNYEPPSAYALDYLSVSLVDTVAHIRERYLTVETANGRSETATLDDVGDVSWTDRTSTYDNTSIGDKITLTSSGINSGEVITTHFDITVKEGERDDLEDTSAMMGPTPGSSGGGGIIDSIVSVPGAVISALGLGAIARYIGFLGGS